MMGSHMTNYMHIDDAPIGRVLTRREALVLLGGVGAAGLLHLAGCGSSSNAVASDTTGMLSTSCAAKPELTEGPYFVDDRLNRSDIRADSATKAVKAGIPLQLSFNISRIQSNACAALAGAFVDVWHCDALGVYSDASDPGFNTIGQDWLRGYQVTDASGMAAFTTIVPGWYQGRATHIHFKIRHSLSENSAYEFTSQLFFLESFLTPLYTQQTPYAMKGDAGRLRNVRDGIYNQGGSQLVLSPAATAEGYTAKLDIGLDVDA